MDFWYENLNRPPLLPPNWLFGPVWMCLYVLIAISMTLLIKNNRRNIEPVLWLNITIHFISNFIWVFLFFTLQSPGLALIDIIVLDITLLFMIYKLWTISKTSASLLIPYLCWVFFATYLNIGFYLLN